MRVMHLTRSVAGSANGMYDGFDSTLGGFAIGADGVLSSGTRLGGFAGASFASLYTDAGTQEINSDSYYAGLYAKGSLY